MVGTSIPTLRQARVALHVFPLVTVLFLIAPEAAYSGERAKAGAGG